MAGGDLNDDQSQPFLVLAHCEKIVKEAIHRHELENVREIERMNRHMTDLEEQIAELKGLILSGFPNEDPPGHKRVHEGYMKEAETREKIRTELFSGVLKSVILAAGGTILIAIWDYIRTQAK